MEKNDLFVLNIFSEVPTVTHGQISLGSYHGNAKIEFKAKTTKSPCTVKTLAIGNNRIKKLEQNDGCKQMLYSIVTEAERDTDDFKNLIIFIDCMSNVFSQLHDKDRMNYSLQELYDIQCERE